MNQFTTYNAEYIEHCDKNKEVSRCKMDKIGDDYDMVDDERE